VGFAPLQIGDDLVALLTPTSFMAALREGATGRPGVLTTSRTHLGYYSPTST
jgi:hypothetical protein